MIRIPSIAVLVALALATFGCAPSEPDGPHLRIRVAPTPPPVGDARIIVQLPEEVGGEYQVTVTARAITDARGLSRTAESVGQNVYAVADFTLSKPGAWRIVARATPKGGGPVLQDSTNVRVIEGGE